LYYNAGYGEQKLNTEPVDESTKVLAIQFYQRHFPSFRIIVGIAPQSMSAKA
jgi:hypothetical protein